MKRYILFILSYLMLTVVALGHDGHKEKKDTIRIDSADLAVTSEHHSEASHVHDTSKVIHEEEHGHYKKVTADFSDFPSQHPLIVHFAIVLLIAGAALHLVNIYFLKKELAWTAFVAVLIGFTAAYLAGRNFHPHTHGLSEHAKLVLEQHDIWADWTINLGFAGLILQGVNLFVMQRKRLAAALVAVILLSAAYAVARAGHYGAQLVHIEGVGPQGKYLELEHSH